MSVGEMSCSEFGCAASSEKDCICLMRGGRRYTLEDVQLRKKRELTIIFSVIFLVLFSWLVFSLVTHCCNENALYPPINSKTDDLGNAPNSPG